MLSVVLVNSKLTGSVVTQARISNLTPRVKLLGPRLRSMQRCSSCKGRALPTQPLFPTEQLLPQRQSTPMPTQLPPTHTTGRNSAPEWGEAHKLQKLSEAKRGLSPGCCKIVPGAWFLWHAWLSHLVTEPNMASHHACAVHGRRWGTCVVSGRQ